MSIFFLSLLKFKEKGKTKRPEKETKRTEQHPQLNVHIHRRSHILSIQRNITMAIVGASSMK